MTLPTYNGYPNYPTWDIALWIDNDQGLQEMVLDMARDATDDHDLAARLEAFVTDEDGLIVAPDPSSPHADILGWALGFVDWRHLAENYIEQVAEEDED